MICNEKNNEPIEAEPDTQKETLGQLLNHYHKFSKKLRKGM